MKQSIDTKFLRTMIGTGYVLIILLIGGIVYTWLGERHELETQEAENRQMNRLRQEVNGVYVRIAELSLLGETVLEWEDREAQQYRLQRLAVDSLLCRFKNTYPAERIDSVRHLLEDKEKQLFCIMDVLDRQEAANEQIARSVPVIAWKSTQEEPKKKKRSNFLGLFGRKEKQPQPTTTTTMLYTLNRDVIARQRAQTRQLAEYADSLATRNNLLNRQLQALIHRMDAKVQGDLQQREQEMAAIRWQSFLQIGGLTGFVILLLLLSYMVIHRKTNRISCYRRETSELIDKLQLALEQNRQLLSARQKMLITITHDLRTPLTAISGYAELIPHEEDAGKVDDYSRHIRQASGHMAAMLNTLLDFFRLDSGKEQMIESPFRLQSAVRTLQAEFEPHAEAKDLTLNVEVCDDVVVMGDRERLIQIGGNLLSNAVKFTNSGTVTLSVSHADNRLALVVTDTGSGMDEEEKQRVFDAFERLPNAATQDGFGLGLSIVRNLVKMLGGTIGVESKVGEGSRVTVTLPMKLADEISEEQQVELSEKEIPQSCSVIVLDNDELTLAMMKEMYLHYGVHCDTCRNVGNLMEAIRQRNYDLLVTDLKMPEMNGYDVLELLRSSNVGNSRTIPVVVATASGSCNEESLLAHGFTGCLFKPFSLAELLDVSERCVLKSEQACQPDFSSLLAYGKKTDMLDTLIAETEKVMESMTEAGERNDGEALDEWIHHLRSSWAVIRTDKTLWKLHELLHRETECPAEEMQQAVNAVLETGRAIVELAKQERETYGKGNHS